MSTRAVVLYGTENKSHGFYVHSDGYMECVGHALRDYYNSSEAALALSEFAFCDGMSFMPQPDMLKTRTEEAGWFLKCFDKEEACFDVMFDDAEPSKEPSFSGSIASIYREADDSAIEWLYWWNTEDENPKWRFVEISDEQDSENIDFGEMESDSVPYEGLAGDIRNILAAWHNDKNFESFMAKSSIYST